LAGHRAGLSTVKRLRARYERDGLWGVIDHRAARRTAPAGYVDPRVVAATPSPRRPTGRPAQWGRLRRRVEQILAGTSQAGDRPMMPPERTFYRLVERLASGRHTFGSARTRRSLAKQPERPFGAVTAARPGEWTQIDSTPLDVRVVHDDGTVDRVELTGLVDQATRTVAAALGEQAWNHARQLLAACGSDPATEAEIATAAADLLDRAGQGPGAGEPAAPQQDQAAGRTRSPRSRRVAGRTAATATPAWPRPAGEDEDPAADGRAEQAPGQPAETESETPPAQVIPLPLFDARKEAEKWW
jgi:sarcosine oxidase gamma subunit